MRTAVAFTRRKAPAPPRPSCRPRSATRSQQFVVRGQRGTHSASGMTSLLGCQRGCRRPLDRHRAGPPAAEPTPCRRLGPPGVTVCGAARKPGYPQRCDRNPRAGVRPATCPQHVAEIRQVDRATPEGGDTPSRPRPSSAPLSPLVAGLQGHRHGRSGTPPRSHSHLRRAPPTVAEPSGPPAIPEAGPGTTPPLARTSGRPQGQEPVAEVVVGEPVSRAELPVDGAGRKRNRRDRRRARLEQERGRLRNGADSLLSRGTA